MTQKQAEMYKLGSIQIDYSKKRDFYLKKNV